jgi:hypothetical protein
VVEDRIARLQDEALAVPWRERADDVAAGALERRLDQARGVGVPPAGAVVRVDDRGAAPARPLEQLFEARKPIAKRSEELLAVLVVEQVDDVDENEGVSHTARIVRSDRGRDRDVSRRAGAASPRGHAPRARAR